jgi:acetyl esterase
MPLSPSARTMLDQLKAIDMPPLWEQDLTALRESDSNVMGALDEPVEVKSAENRTIPCSVGDMPVRIYTPESKQPRPLIVYYHGGGFVFCSLDTHDGTCRRLANATGAVVVSVDYRLAPECQFPGPAEDCYEAAIWAHRHADELDADAEVFAVAGDSAGGNLAAVTALKARERGGPPIACQILIYPVIDAACETPSFTTNGEGYFLDAESMRWMWSQYLGPEGDGTHPHASPIRADDHADLPPAIVITAEYDPLRDEGEAYADKLRAAGVPVTMVRYDGMIHGFVSMPMLFPEGDQAMDEIANALQTHP